MENKLNVLIVEDDSADRNDLIAQLDEQHDRINVIGVIDNSEKALQIVKNDCSDAVILD